MMVDMNEETGSQPVDLRVPLTLAASGAALVFAAACILWVGHGEAVALALMTGESFLNCF